jgi:Predicted hydrolases or acyltransferases (alpha/beta hydrolase superfamily)
MNWIRKLLLGAVLLILALAAIEWIAGLIAKSDLARQFPPPGQLVDIGGYRLHLHCVGQGRPAIIMDAGANDFSVQWVTVQAEVSKSSRACSYDRAGFGWSDASPYPRTSDTMIGELHTLLENAKVEGPYVLVGHSFGGMNMRLFAHRFPKEVMGMVLVDPAHEALTLRVPALQRLTQQAAGQFRTLSTLSSLGFIALSPERIPDRGLSGTALARYRAILATTHYFDAAIAETESIEKSYAQMRQENITSLGNIPLVVISRGLSDPLPGASEIENRQFDQAWKEFQAELAALSPKGTQIIAAKSQHYIQLTQPQLVIDAIRNVAQQGN